MAKIMISKKRKALSMNDVSIVKLKRGVKVKKHDPNKKLNDQKFIAASLTQAILENDKVAFLEILEGHIKAKNISEVERQTGLRRSTIYSAIEQDANPTLDTILTLVHAN